VSSNPSPTEESRNLIPDVSELSELPDAHDLPSGAEGEVSEGTSLPVSDENQTSEHCGDE
jgi:hypothetical protein